VPLLSTARSTTQPAQPLPITNKHLLAHGITLRQNQFSLSRRRLASVSPWWRPTCIKTPCPSVYFSADSDEWTVKTRAASILTGYPLEQIDSWLTQGGKSEQSILAQLAKADHVDWCFRSSTGPGLHRLPTEGI
jgi:hypothetical protein